MMEINLGVMENGQRSKEAVQLLRDGHDSSSSDVHYHYQLPPPQTAFAGRKKVYRKHRRKSPSGSVSSSGETSGRGGKSGGNGGRGHGPPCFPRMSRFVNWLLAFAVFVGASALFWVIYGLRLDLVSLERRVHDFEAGNQKLPNQLHEYHTKLKSVTENQTALVTQVVAISDKMSDITAQLASLSAAVAKLESGLKQSGTGDLLSLPGDVTKMQGTMASFGSQLRDVASELSSMRNATAALGTRLDAGDRRLGGVEAAVGRMNGTDGALASLNATLQWAVEDLHLHHASIEELKKSGSLIAALETSLRNLTDVVRSVSSVADGNSAAVQLFSQRLSDCCPAGQYDVADGGKSDEPAAASTSSAPSPPPPPPSPSSSPSPSLSSSSALSDRDLASERTPRH